MKVQGKIFKLLPSYFYVKSLLHGVICVTKCQHSSSAPWHISVNDYTIVTEKLAVRFTRNFTCILIGSRVETSTRTRVDFRRVLGNSLLLGYLVFTSINNKMSYYLNNFFPHMMENTQYTSRYFTDTSRSSVKVTEISIRAACTGP